MEGTVRNPIISDPAKTVLSLPSEVIKIVFGYLGYDDLINVEKVCLWFRSVAQDPTLWKIIRLDDDILNSGKTLHQVLFRFPKAQRLDVLPGCRATKTFCMRIAKDLPTLKHLSMHLSTSRFYSMDQELENIANILPHLSSVQIVLKEHDLSTVGILRAVKLFRSLDVFQIYQTDFTRERDSKDDDATRRLDVDAIVSLIGQHHPRLRKLRIDFQSYRDVRRFSAEGLSPLSTSLSQTLTHLHVSHCLFSNSCVALLASLRLLRRLGLRGVEGFRTSDWIQLFLRRNGSATTLTFPDLESLCLDFPSNAVLLTLRRHYGTRLKELTLDEYTQLFSEEDDDDETLPTDLLSDEFASMESLEKLFIRLKSNFCNSRIQNFVVALSEREDLSFKLELTRNTSL